MPTRPCQPSRRNLASIAVIRSNGTIGLPISSRPISSTRWISGFMRQLGVGEDVGAAGDALVGLDVDQHQRRPTSIDAEGVFHGTLERHDDASRLDAADRWDVICSCLTFPHSTRRYHRTKPRRGPIGRGGFNQPAPGMFGSKRDALGLAGLDRERVEPERLPAIVEPVEQAEMVAVEMEDGRDIGAVGQRQHDDAPGLGAEGRLG